MNAAVSRFPELLDLIMAHDRPDENNLPPCLAKRRRANYPGAGHRTSLGAFPTAPRWVEGAGWFALPRRSKEIRSSERQLRCKREVVFALGDYLIRWKVFLDNSPPSGGERWAPISKVLGLHSNTRKSIEWRQERRQFGLGQSQSPLPQVLSMDL